MESALGGAVRATIDFARNIGRFNVEAQTGWLGTMEENVGEMRDAGPRK